MNRNAALDNPCVSNGEIADALSPDDVREHSRIIGVLEEVAAAFAECFFQVVENLPDAEPEQTQQQSRGMSR